MYALSASGTERVSCHEAFIIAHVTRISTTVWGEGYIPEESLRGLQHCSLHVVSNVCGQDNTGDVFLYQGLELLGVLVVVFQAKHLPIMSCLPVNEWQTGVALQVMRLSAVRNSQDVGQGIERWSQLIGMRSLDELCIHVRPCLRIHIRQPQHQGLATIAV